MKIGQRAFFVNSLDLQELSLHLRFFHYNIFYAHYKEVRKLYIIEKSLYPFFIMDIAIFKCMGEKMRGFHTYLRPKL